MTKPNSITKFPQAKQLLVHDVTDSMVTGFVALPHLRDKHIDGLELSNEVAGYTHKFSNRFHIEFLRMRITKYAMKKLLEKNKVVIDGRTYFYENNQAYLPDESGKLVYPAFLFTFELKPDGTYKGRKFKSMAANEYSIDECHSQIPNVEDPAVTDSGVAAVKKKLVKSQPKSQQPPFETSVISDEIRKSMNCLIYLKQMGENGEFDVKTNKITLVQEQASGN